MKDVILASTLHDPRGVFLNYIEKACDEVLKGYAGWVINVTSYTDEKVEKKLRSLGVVMTKADPDHPRVPDNIENDHLNALEKAAEHARGLGFEKIQYTDGDRIIMAAIYYAGDLQRMAESASELIGNNRSYINFLRDGESFLSHHPPLVQTEFEIIGLYTKAFGIPLDPGSTAHGMSVDVADRIVVRSPEMEPVTFPHPKWIFIAREMGVEISSEEIKKVLTFETALQYRKEVKQRLAEDPSLRLGLRHNPPPDKYGSLQRAYMATIGLDSTYSKIEWGLRFKTEIQYLEFLKNHLGGLGGTAESLEKEIEYTLASIGMKRAAIEGTSGQPAYDERRRFKYTNRT